MLSAFVLGLSLLTTAAVPAGLPARGEGASTLDGPVRIAESSEERQERRRKRRRKRRSNRKSSRQKKRGDKRSTKKKATKKKGPAEIPIEVATGPIFLLPSTPLLLEDQPVHTGMMLSMGAILNREVIQANKGRLSKTWQPYADLAGEVKVSPWWLMFIPKVLIISPGWVNTGMYGAIWRPYSLGIAPELGPVKLSADAAIDLAYIFMHSRTAGEEFTHFLRPGLNLEASARLPITRWILVSAGWSSSFFPPQKLGGWPWEFLPLDRTLWHLGGPFFKIHIRFPYEMDL